MNRPLILFLNVFIVATCGLIYELLAGTLASYVLGDSVTQFSLVIGLYLSALGVGAWLSGFLDTDRLARAFLEAELAVALLGGFSAPLLMLSSGRITWFPWLLYLSVFSVGVLVGLELPLLMRIVKDQLPFKDLVAQVLAFDYIGALAASLLFPIFFVPRLGLVRTSLCFGILNALVGLWGTWLLRPLLKKPPLGLRVRAGFVLALLALGLFFADKWTKWAEASIYADEIVYTRSSAYQRILVTQGKAGFSLFLNGHLQFHSADEYRYHEALVHPALALAQTTLVPKRVLILGGGDGLALREVLKYPAVEQVTLVDLDPEMTQLAERFPPLGVLNQQAYRDPRVEVVNADAMIWLEKPGELYSAVIIDFPDPSSYPLGKLYTTRFYKLLQRRLHPDAALSLQCTSPLDAKKTYWCIIRTLEASGFYVQPYQAPVPSFGIWGFALARRTPFATPTQLSPLPLRYLNEQVLSTLFVLPKDVLLAENEEVEINRLDNQVLVRYHDLEWGRKE